MITVPSTEGEQPSVEDTSSIPILGAARAIAAPPPVDQARVLRDNFAKSTGTDPEEAARFLEMSRMLGTSPQLVAERPTEAKQVFESMMFDPSRMLEQSPMLADIVQDPALMQVYRDELDTHSDLEYRVSRLLAPLAVGTLGIAEAIPMLPEVMGRMIFPDGSAPRQAIDAATTGVLRIPGQEPIKLGGYRGSSGVSQDINQFTADQIATDPYMRRVAQNVELGNRALSKGLEGDGEAFGELVNSPGVLLDYIGLAAPSLAVTWASGGNLKVIGTLEALSQSTDAADFERRTGVRIPDAEYRAVIGLTGVVNGLLEKFGFDQLTAGGKTGIVGILSKGLTEAGTEGLQSVIPNTLEQQTYNPEQEISEGVLPGMVGGFGLGTTIASVDTGLRRIERRASESSKKVAEAQNFSAKLDNITTIIEGTQAIRRDATSFRTFTGNIAQKAGVEDLYVDPKSLQQAGIDIDALRQASPTFDAQIDEALVNGTVVKIPVAEYLTDVTGMGLAKQLNEHMRSSPEGFSKYEAEEFMSTEGDRLKAEVERIINTAEGDTAYAAERSAVENDIFNRLTTTQQYTPTVARAYAKLSANFFAARAARSGEALGAYYARSAPTIKAEDLAQPGTYMQQSVRGQQVAADGTIELVHFSSTPGLTTTDVSQWGATKALLTRDERNRIGTAPGRNYFYLNEAGKEPQLGDIKYTTRVPAERIYDLDADPLNLSTAANQVAKDRGIDWVSARELLVRDAGYLGYVTTPQAGRDVVVSFENLVLQGAQDESSPRTGKINAAVGRLLGRGDVSGSAGLLAQSAGPNLEPLEGAPGPVDVPGVGSVTFGPFAPARAAAEAYMARAGLAYQPPTNYVEVNTDRAVQLAAAFEAMEHNPTDPLVEQAYREMIDQVLAQYQVIKETGLQIELIEGDDPYAASPRLAILDVTENNHLWIFPTDGGFGGDSSLDVNIDGNPLLDYTDEYINGRRLRANDVFRIVHDYFGHIKDGNGFRARGEENAWQSHAAMFTPLARRAMTTETRGQNSWVNYGSYGDKNRTASGATTDYAPQKIGLLPEWASQDGFDGGMDSGIPVALFQDAGPSMIGGKSIVTYQGRRRKGPRRVTDAGNLGKGPYVSPSTNLARGYGEEVTQRSVTINNPLVVVRDGNYIKNIAKAAKKLGVKAEPQWSGSKQMSDEFAIEFTEKALAAGYDGAVATLPNGDIVEAVQYAQPKTTAQAADGVLYQLDEVGIYSGFADGGFFSKMYRHLEEKLNATGTVAQYRAQIESFIKKGDFKQEEFDWSGLSESLDAIEATMNRTLERKVYGTVNENGEFEAISTAPREGLEERTVTRSAKIEKAQIMDALRSTSRGSFVIEETALTEDSAYSDLPLWDDVTFSEFEQRHPEDSDVQYFVDDLMEQIESDPEGWASRFVGEDGTVDDEAVREWAWDWAFDAAPQIATADVAGEEYTLQVEPENGMYFILNPEGKPVDDGKFSGSRNGYEVVKGALYDYLSDYGLIRFEGYEDGGPKYEENYTEEGPKSKYTELLIHLPNIQDKGVSQHFDDPGNVMMQIRFDRRSGENGKSVLFVEEIQSDWHQQGRSQGYILGDAPSATALKDALTRARNELKYKLLEYADSLGYENPTQAVTALVTNQDDWQTRWPDMPDIVRPAVVDFFAALEANENAGEIADAPFKTTWPELAMKRVMLYAALSGYDQVAWTTGEMQAERYSSALQLKVQDIAVDQMNADGLIPVSVTAANSIRGGADAFIARQVGAKVNELGYALLTQEQIAKVFGKGIAEQILEAEARSADSGTMTTIEGADLKINDKGMIQFYDNMLPGMTNKLLKRFNTSVNPMNVMLSEKTAVLGFNVTQEMKNEILKSTGGFPLFQKANGPAPRGSYNPDTNTISIFKAQNLSTFLHESGHMFLELMVRDASAADAAPADKRDVETLLKWMKVGVEDGTRLAVWNTMTLEQKREAHETFARGTEAYLMEGKAPSLELRDMFRQFRAWLVKIYKDAVNLNVQLNPEIREVFDRMLATDEQISDAETVYSYESLFSTPVATGLPPEDILEYEKLGVAATQEAAEQLQSRSLRDMKWLGNARAREIKKLQRQAAARRKEVKDEVTAEVMAEPINQARQFLRNGVIDGEKVEGGYKLSIAELEAMYAETPILAIIRQQLGTGLYGMTGRENAIHPDQAAQSFGFTSGDHLVRELLAAEDAQQKIEGITDQRMLERYGDLTDQQTIERAADKAVHNEARGKFVATQLAALQQAIGERRLLLEAAKQFARETIGRQRVRDITPGRYTAAEARAAREADAALRKDDIKAAARAKRAQLIQFYSAKEAYDAIDEIEKMVRYFKKFDKKAVRKKIGAEYADQIDAILETYELRKVTNKALDKRKGLAKWLEEQEALGLQPDIDPDIVAASAQKNFREATVEELRGVYDSVKQIEHLGRLKNKLLAAKDAREFAVIEAELTESILRNARGKSVDNRTRANKGIVDLFKGFVASHRKVASLAYQFDGFEMGGPFFRAFIRSMNERGDMETTMRAEATREMAKILDPLLPSMRKRNQADRGKFGGKGIYFPSIGISLNREERLGVALNRGNNGNLQRLLDGRGWTMEQIQPVLDTLTKAEWDAVQQIWDLFESYRPKIAAKERKLYGKEPTWVEPIPFETKFGVYAGGYYPVKYDARENVKAKQFEAAEQAKQQMQGAFTSSTTRRSFTKERAKKVVNMPVLLTMDALYRGVNEVIHDLAWHEWLIDANRIISNPRINRAIANSYGDVIVNQLEKAIIDIAQGENPKNTDLDRVLADLRAGATVAGLGFNIVNTILNVTGLVPAMSRVGPKWVAIGIGKFASNPRQAIADVHAKSEMMRNRSRTMLREINEMQSVVRGKTEVRRTMDQLLFMPLTMTQMAIDTPIWLGAYEKQMSLADDESLAIAVADQSVIDTQSGGQIKDLAAIQRGGAAQKLFTTFYGYFSASYNLTVESTKKTDFRDPQDVIRLAGDYLLVLIVPAMLSTLIKLALVGDDDDWEADKVAKTLVNDQISYLFGLMVGVREISGAVQAAAGVSTYTSSYGGPAGLRFFQEVVKLGQQINQGEADDALFKSFVNVIGVLFKLPSAQINRTVLGIDALIEGDTENPAAIIAGPPKK